MHMALLAAAFGLAWMLLATKGEERSFLGRVLAIGIVAVAEAVVLTQSGVLVYGLACGAVAASVGGAALVDCLLGVAVGDGRRLTFSGFIGAAGAITFSLGCLIVLGLFFANLSALNAVLLLAALRGGWRAAAEGDRRPAAVASIGGSCPALFDPIGGRGSERA